MQRQSLGGSPPPSSSLHLHRSRDTDLLDDEKAAKSPSKPRRLSTCSSSSPPSPSSPLPQNQKFIHAIPLLTMLCFLVLFLFSHDPSPSDLAQFKGLRRGPPPPPDLIDAGDGGEVGRWRNLQGSNKSRINRKFADF